MWQSRVEIEAYSAIFQLHWCVQSAVSNFC